jgi:hypothetical protein
MTKEIVKRLQEPQTQREGEWTQVVEREDEWWEK